MAMHKKTMDNILWPFEKLLKIASHDNYQTNLSLQSFLKEKGVLFITVSFSVYKVMP